MNLKSLNALLDRTHSPQSTQKTALLIMMLLDLVLTLHDMLLLAHG